MATPLQGRWRVPRDVRVRGYSDENQMSLQCNLPEVWSSKMAAGSRTQETLQTREMHLLHDIRQHNKDRYKCTDLFFPPTLVIYDEQPYIGMCFFVCVFGREID